MFGPSFEALPVKRRIGLTQADMTWNPWEGCHKVSAGCRLCYMFAKKMVKGEDPTVVMRSDANFQAPLSWDRPKKVFVCSLSDWFLPDADPWRPEAWEIIRQTPQHIYMIVTKYSERIAEHLPEGWPFPNVYLGVTVEDQETADERIPHLLATEGVARFVNAEPLLGPLNLAPFMDRKSFLAWAVKARKGRVECKVEADPAINWVTVGQELGPDARYMDQEWLRPLVGQVRRVGADFFYKQDARI